VVIESYRSGNNDAVAQESDAGSSVYLPLVRGGLPAVGAGRIGLGMLVHPTP
jgi:hypothetical protein